MTDDDSDRSRLGAMAGSPTFAAPSDPVLARTHARLLLLPILWRTGCDAAPLDAVLDALVARRRLDGPATVHWLLGWHPRLAPGLRPLDLWMRGRHADVIALARGG